MKTISILLVGVLGLAAETLRAEPEPVRFAIVGLVHDHARGFIPTASARKDIRLVAIVEPNRELAARYARDYRLPDTLFHTNLESMLDHPGFLPFYWCGKPNPLQSRVFCTLGLNVDDGHWFLDHTVLPEPAVRWRIEMLNLCFSELGLPAIDVDVPDGVAWESFEGDSRR